MTSLSLDWKQSSVVECLPNMCEPWAQSPALCKLERKKKKVSNLQRPQSSPYQVHSFTMHFCLQMQDIQAHFPIFSTPICKKSFATELQTSRQASVTILTTNQVGNNLLIIQNLQYVKVVYYKHCLLCDFLIGYKQKNNIDHNRYEY